MSLDPANYKLSPELLDEILANDYKKKNKYFKNFYDMTSHRSPEEIAHQKLEALELTMSQPLKKMHLQYLTKVTKNCYQEKHLSEDFPNQEQIELCKKMTYDSIFGDFEQKRHDFRTKDSYNMQICMIKAKNHVYRARN